MFKSHSPRNYQQENHIKKVENRKSDDETSDENHMKNRK